MSYSVQSSKELMESLVEDYLNRWRIYHPNPDTDNFVTTKNQEEIIQYIMKNMVLEMTDTIRSQLSIAYRVDTDEELLTSIKEVAKISVLNYTIQQNRTIPDIPNFNLF